MLRTRGWMEVRELEGVDTRDGVMVSWGELTAARAEVEHVGIRRIVASFGMDFWSQGAPMKAIAAALGAHLADAHPRAPPPRRPGSAHPPPRDPGRGTPHRPRR